MKPEEILSALGLGKTDVRALSIHGIPALRGHMNGLTEFLAVIRGRRGPRLLRKRIAGVNKSVIMVGEEELRRDCESEELGGIVAYRLLIPYVPLIGRQLLEELESAYKRHISLESLRNLVLEHRLAATHIIIKPEFFLYDKLRRMATIYPPSRLMIKTVFTGEVREKAIEESLRIFRKALRELVSKGLLVERDGGFSPSQSLVEEVFSSTPYARVVDELEHAFKAYLSAGQAPALGFMGGMELRFSALTPPRLPDPEEYLFINTSLGLQSLSERLEIEDFVEKFFGVRRRTVKVRRLGGVLNATYVAEFPSNGKKKRVFVKKYLNWTDFKWVVAWLWALGVKNFSVLASTRMSNEIYFINRLAELGFNTAEILHVNWKRKTLFQRFVEGENGVQALKRSRGTTEFNELSRKMGGILSRLHSRGITLGDSNPFSFLFTKENDEIYLIDLEQCSVNGLKSWDLAELVYYTGHYLSAKDAEAFAYHLVTGYLEGGGEKDVVEKVLDVRYQRLLALWTPIWVMRREGEAVKRALKDH